MKNLSANEEKLTAFGADGERVLAAASSPDQLAVVWGAGEAVAASPALTRASASGAASASYEMDVTRLPADFRLAAALKMRRENYLGLPPLSSDTLFLTAVPYFSERTRVMALAPEVLALDDFELIEWLVNAEKQLTLGTDNHPLFESALEDVACSIVRLPNGRVAMTEVPRQHVQASREKIRLLLGEGTPSFVDLTVETPLRCAARYFLAGLPEGAAVLAPGKEHEATAFLLVSETGFSYGLWSPATGLFSEYAFLAPTEINSQAPGADELPITPYETDGGYEQKFNEPGLEESGEAESLRGERLESYVRHAFDQLFLQLSPEKLGQLGLSNYAQAVWVAEPRLSEIIAPIAKEYSENTNLKFFQMGVRADEAVAGGLLFGSFTFGDETAAGAQILPPVNLARDIMVLADKEEIERRRIEEVRVQKRRNRAVFTLLAAPVLVLACLLAVAADIVRSQFSTAFRESRADARTRELKPALDRRKSYEANLKWYQEFITQVSRLRRQQPVGINLHYELNSHYPFGIDPSFYVSDLKLQLNGEMEIKGRARNTDAVTSFLRALEFAGGPQSGTKLFSNLAYEVQEGAPIAIPAGQTRLPAIPGAALNGALAPGVVAWSIKGKYVPMAEFVPPPPAKKGAPKAKPTVAAPTPTP